MWVWYLLIGVIIIAGVIYFWRNIRPNLNTRRNLSLLGKDAPTLTQDGITFRDLNKNGKLDPYEDPRRPIEERVADLLGQMTLEEKAGMLFHTMIGMNKDGTLLENMGMFPLPQSSDMIARRLMNHFNIFMETANPRHMAEWHNRIQKLAEQTRLGIPITISTDPRHAFTQNPLSSMMAGSFSQFPEQTGFAATRDVDLVQQFGDIARQEYLAVGIRLALHPMADLATEPRWCRANGTFGEDAAGAAIGPLLVTGELGQVLRPVRHDFVRPRDILRPDRVLHGAVKRRCRGCPGLSRCALRARIHHLSAQNADNETGAQRQSDS
jgi:beta-glucosidase